MKDEVYGEIEEKILDIEEIENDVDIIFEIFFLDLFFNFGYYNEVSREFGVIFLLCFIVDKLF